MGKDWRGSREQEGAAVWLSHKSEMPRFGLASKGRDVKEAAGLRVQFMGKGQAGDNN